MKMKDFVQLFCFPETTWFNIYYFRYCISGLQTHHISYEKWYLTTVFKFSLTNQYGAATKKKYKKSSGFESWICYPESCWYRIMCCYGIYYRLDVSGMFLYSNLVNICHRLSCSIILLFVCMYVHETQNQLKLLVQ